jgi:hypothetical protein
VIGAVTGAGGSASFGVPWGWVGAEGGARGEGGARRGIGRRDAPVGRERVAQGRHVGEALGGVALEGLHHHGGEGRVEVGAKLRDGGGVLRGLGDDEGVERVGVEGVSPREGFVHGDAEGVLVGGAGDGLRRHDLLGGHVRGRAEGHRGRGEVDVVLAAFGDAEVDNLRHGLGVAVFEGEEDVVGLDVPVDDAALVGEGQGAQDGVDDGEEARDGELSLALEQGVHRLAAEVLHHDEGAVAVEAVVGKLHDVAVLKLRGGFGLLEEARGEHRVGGDLGLEDLDRDDAAEELVAGLEDGAHAALAEEAHDLVVFAHGVAGAEAEAGGDGGRTQRGVLQGSSHDVGPRGEG